MTTKFKKLAILFPGGGVQYTGMGKKLYERYEVAQNIFHQAEDIVKKPLRKWCFEQNDQYHKMNVSLLSTFVCSIAAYETFVDSFDVCPDFLAGHSLGEYSALTCAGAISFADGLLLVDKRSELLQQAGGDSQVMVAINKIGISTVVELCDHVNKFEEQVFISVYNTERQHVISGTPAGIKNLVALVAAYGGEATLLEIYCPSHCRLMASAADEFSDTLAKVKFQAPRIPVVSNLTAHPYDRNSDFRSLLKDHLVKPVMWEQSIRYILNCDVELLVDMGPKNILKQMMSHVDSNASTLAYEDAADMQRFNTPHTFSAFHIETAIKHLSAIAVCTPNSEYDEIAYSKVYSLYHQLQTAVSNGIAPSQKTFAYALDLLHQILAIKKVPLELQVKYFEKHFNGHLIKKFNILQTEPSK